MPLRLRTTHGHLGQRHGDHQKPKTQSTEVSFLSPLFHNFRELGAQSCGQKPGRKSETKTEDSASPCEHSGVKLRGSQRGEMKAFPFPLSLHCGQRQLVCLIEAKPLTKGLCVPCPEGPQHCSAKAQRWPLTSPSDRAFSRPSFLCWKDMPTPAGPGLMARGTHSLALRCRQSRNSTFVPAIPTEPCATSGEQMWRS